jgi:hypothetical protein
MNDIGRILLVTKVKLHVRCVGSECRMLAALRERIARLGLTPDLPETKT